MNWIEQINREAERKNKKSQAFYNWLAKQKHPLNRRSLGKYSKFRLNEMKDAGIMFVEILGDRSVDGACSVCRDLEGRKMEIELAVLLPLPGCDKKVCMCLWLARK